MKKSTLTFILSVIIIIIAGIGLGTYFILQSRNKQSETRTPTPTSSDSQSQSQSSTPTSTPTTQPTPIPVKVYFSKHPESDDDPLKVFPVSRTSLDRGIATYVIEQLLVGPTASESAKGYFTTVRVRNDTSNCGDHDFTIGIKDTVATLRFCRTFDAIGVMSDGQAQETLKASLLQFPTIKKVIILTKDGNCQFDLSGENFCLR